MKNRILLPLILLSVCVIGCGTVFRQPIAFAQSSSQDLNAPADIVPLDAFVQLDVEVPFSPGVLPTTDKKILSYELYVTNMIPLDYVFNRVDVIDADTQQVVRSLQGSELRKQVRISGENQIATDTKDPIPLNKGQRAIVFFFLEFPNNTLVPSKLSHRLFVTTPAGEKILNFEETTTVGQTTPVVLAPPLNGGPWLCDGAPASDSYHRRTLLSVDGVSRISQRYAIDFELLTPQGTTFTGDPSVNENYPCYSEPILASHSGTVAKVITGLPDNTPPEVPPFTDVDRVGGNGVILDIGNGKFIVHGHMQPGSITLKAGDNVVVGQQLGLIGNSGNSFEPHLHIQVCDRPSFLGAQGVPYVFSDYSLIEGSNSSQRNDELPTLNQVINFPNTAVASTFFAQDIQKNSSPKCAWH